MAELSELFTLYKDYPSGGKIWLMMGSNSTDSDFNDILTIAERLATNGHEVKLLHAVHYKDPLYRVIFGELIGTRYYRKCPDLLIDGDYYEYESYNTSNSKNAFRNMMHNGLSQSDNIILRHCNLSDGYMLRAIKGYLQINLSIARVMIFDGENVRLLYKTEGWRKNRQPSMQRVRRIAFANVIIFPGFRKNINNTYQ